MHNTIKLTIVLALTSCTVPCEVERECDPDGRCWVAEGGWSEMAEEAVPDRLADAVDAGSLVPVGDCWESTASDASVCAVDVGCVVLLVRPLDEVVADGPACGGEGPWSHTSKDGDVCWGILDGGAVELR